MDFLITSSAFSSIATTSTTPPPERSKMAVKILELCHVAPPEGSVQPCALPLTFMDLLWYMFPISVERVFLYPAPRCSAAAFLSDHLPNLKLSLSRALQLFYPLAGRLVPHTDTDHPCIRYSDGDSVVLTVAESDDDLQGLTSDGPKDNALFRCLVPSLPSPETDHHQPVVAVQVTVFPEQGVAVGISTLHAALDGSSSSHFMRTWASLCRSQAGEEEEEEESPAYDRSQIPEPFDLHSPTYSNIEQARSLYFRAPGVRSQPDVVRATFCLTRAQIEGLRKWAAGRTVAAGGGARFSSFTLAVAVAWTCLLKARGREPKESEGLIFPVDCRGRPGFSLPASYFGNAVGGCLVKVGAGALVGEEGLAAAAVAIREALRDIPVGFAALRSGVEGTMDGSESFSVMAPFSLAGSPRLRVYDLDLGWGRPAKVEVVSIDGTGAMSLAESRREGVEDGLEMGLALPAGVMEAFSELFRTTVAACS